MFVCFALACLIITPAPAQDLQTWKSKSGKMTSAIFYSYDESAKAVTILIPKVVSLSDLDDPSIVLAKELASKTNENQNTRSRAKKSSERKVDENSALIPFRIMSLEEIKGKKISFDVHVDLIDGKLPTKDQLAAISNGLVKDLKHERKFVGFYLPEMKIDQGYFATAHHLPKIEVKIQDFSLPEKYKSLLDQP